MGINGEKFSFWNTNCSEFERTNERQKLEKPFSRQEPHLICEFIKCKAAATEPQEGGVGGECIALPLNG